MVKIVVSQEVREQLGRVGQVVELCDSSGRALGHFVPAVASDPESVSGECPYTAEELARMRSETGGRTLAEIWEVISEGDF